MARNLRPVARVMRCYIFGEKPKFSVDISAAHDHFGGEEVARYPDRATARQHAKVINEAIRWKPLAKPKRSATKARRRHDGDPSTYKLDPTE